MHWFYGKLKIHCSIYCNLKWLALSLTTPRFLCPHRLSSVLMTTYDPGRRQRYNLRAMKLTFGKLFDLILNLENIAVFTFLL